MRYQTEEAELPQYCLSTNEIWVMPYHRQAVVSRRRLKWGVRKALYKRRRAYGTVFLPPEETQ